MLTPEGVAAAASEAELFFDPHEACRTMNPEIIGSWLKSFNFSPEKCTPDRCSCKETRNALRSITNEPRSVGKVRICTNYPYKKPIPKKFREERTPMLPPEVHNLPPDDPHTSNSSKISSKMIREGSHLPVDPIFHDDSEIETAEIEASIQETGKGDAICNLGEMSPIREEPVHNAEEKSRIEVKSSVGTDKTDKFENLLQSPDSMSQNDLDSSESMLIEEKPRIEMEQQRFGDQEMEEDDLSLSEPMRTVEKTQRGEQKPFMDRQVPQRTAKQEIPLSSYKANLVPDATTSPQMVSPQQPVNLRLINPADINLSEIQRKPENLSSQDNIKIEKIKLKTKRQPTLKQPEVSSPNGYDPEKEKIGAYIDRIIAEQTRMLQANPLEKRGRGRPKGSKNKVPSMVMQEAIGIKHEAREEAEIADNQPTSYQRQHPAICQALKKTRKPRQLSIRANVPYSIVAGLAIHNAKKPMTSRQIYRFAKHYFPQCVTSGHWKNSLRHILCTNISFKKLDGPSGGNACLWTLDPEHSDKLWKIVEQFEENIREPHEYGMVDPSLWPELKKGNLGILDEDIEVDIQDVKRKPTKVIKSNFKDEAEDHPYSASNGRISPDDELFDSPSMPNSPAMPHMPHSIPEVQMMPRQPSLYPHSDGYNDFASYPMSYHSQMMNQHPNYNFYPPPPSPQQYQNYYNLYSQGHENHFQEQQSPFYRGQYPPPSPMSGQMFVRPPSSQSPYQMDSPAISSN